MFRYSLSAIAVLLFLLVTACSKDPDNTIKIAFTGPLSGEVANYGASAKNALQLALDEANASKSLEKKLVLTAFDDKCDTTLAKEIAETIVDQEFQFVVGPVCNEVAEVVLPIFNSAEILVISPAITKPSLTLSKKYPYFFRTISHDFKQGELQAKFLLKYGLRKIALVHDETVFGKSSSDSLRAKINKKVNVVLVESFALGTQDFSSLIAKIKQANPEIVVFSGSYADAAKLVTQTRLQGVATAFLGNDTLKDAKFIELAALAAEGFLLTAPVDSRNNPEYKKFFASYVQNFALEPSVYSLPAYVAVEIIKESLLLSPEASNKKLREILLTKEFSSAMGLIGFDENGDLANGGFDLYQIVNKKFEKFDI